jgi:hypothetical protein
VLLGFETATFGMLAHLTDHSAKSHPTCTLFALTLSVDATGRGVVLASLEHLHADYFYLGLGVTQHLLGLR